MPTRGLALALAGLLLSATAVVADAVSDVRIETRRDEDRNIIWLLVNRGNRTVEAKLEMKKDCTGNRRQPRVKMFWVGAGESVQIARAWAETSCRHTYRVLEATYR